MRTVRAKKYTEERALYNSESLEVLDSVFEDGESPLKESNSIVVDGCTFKWRYPLWYCTKVKVSNTDFLEGARAGVWYTNGVEIDSCIVNSPKTFRRCNDIKLKNVDIPNGKETLWECKRVTLDGVRVSGEYFCMNCENVVAEDISVTGAYSFDGCKNVEIRGSRLLSKDAFWNCENVTVYDSYVYGEYIGWNSKNVTFVNCTLQSNQGFCYMQNLTMRGCKLVNTDLAFEYSTVDAEIRSEIESVKNPISGRICARGIKELVLDEAFVDPSKTEIVITEK